MGRAVRAYHAVAPLPDYSGPSGIDLLHVLEASLRRACFPMLNRVLSRLVSRQVPASRALSECIELLEASGKAELLGNVKYNTEQVDRTKPWIGSMAAMRLLQRHWRWF